jgi:hypothetical protein
MAAIPPVLGVFLVLGLSGSPVAALTPTAGVHPQVTTCTDSWNAAVSGLWTTAANWSTGFVPTSSDNVCITAGGTYTVTIEGTASAATVTLGGTAGSESLSIAGARAVDSSLTLSQTGSSIGKHGALNLTSKGSARSGYALIGGGPNVTVTNAGIFQTSAGTIKSPSYLRVNLTDARTGKTEINGVTSEDGNGGATTLTNGGSFSVGSTGSLALTNGSSFTQSNGTFTNHGTFTQNTGTFTQSGGADSGHHTVVVNGTLNDSAALGNYTFDLFGSDSLGGTIPRGQTVDVIGNGTYSSTATLEADLTNDGTLELNAGTTPGSGFAALAGPSYTVTNAGAFKTAGGVNNPNYLRTSVTNTSNGTVGIDGVTNEDGSGGATTFINNGAFSVGLTKGSLALSDGSSFTQSGGTMTINGILSQNTGTFTQSGGIDSGDPVSVTNATLTDSAGSGTYTFDLFGTDGLAGTIPSGQTVDVIGNRSFKSVVDLAGNLTNDGTLELDAETGSGSGSVQLVGQPYTVTNAGTLETEGGTVSADYLRTNVINAIGASVDIDGVTNEDGSGGATTLTNNGTLSVSDGAGLTLSNGSAFSQSSTGTFAPTVDASTGAFGVTGGVNSLAGTLDVNTVGAPALGSTYNVIRNSSSLLGAFSALLGAYTVSYSSTAVTVQAT